MGIPEVKVTTGDQCMYGLVARSDNGKMEPARNFTAENGIGRPGNLKLSQFI